MTRTVVLPGSSKALAELHDVMLFDLDGVIYIGQAPVPHAVEAIAEMHRAYGTRAAYVTNNASRTPAQVAAHLRSLGLDAADSDVVTSAQAAARVLAEHLPPGSRVLVLGALGMTWAVEERGLIPVETLEDDPAAVVQGYNPDMTWHHLAEATYGINKGLLWVASNTDRTIPTARGIGPGNGSLVKALEHATGRTPIVAGKPEPPLMLESIERTAATTPLVIGDRLDTDIEGGVRSGIPGLLVMTGVTDACGALSAAPGERPTHIAADLRALLEPMPEATVLEVTGREVTGLDDGRTFEGFCGDAVVAIDGTGQPTLTGTDRIDLLRAGCALTWHLADRGDKRAADLPGLIADRLPTQQ